MKKINLSTLLIALFSSCTPAFSGDFQGSGGGTLYSSTLVPHLGLIKQVIDEYNNSAQGINFETVKDSNGQLFVYTSTGRLYAATINAKGVGPVSGAFMGGDFQGGGGGPMAASVSFKIKDHINKDDQPITFTLFGMPKTTPAFNEIAAQGGIKAITTLPVEIMSITITTSKTLKIIGQ